jgi:hypothetical protein
VALYARASSCRRKFEEDSAKMACRTALDGVDASENAILSMRGARTRPWWQANMSEPEAISTSQNVSPSMVAVDR